MGSRPERPFVVSRRSLLPLAAAGALAGFATVPRASAALTTSGTGNDNGFFYSYWNDGGGQSSMELGAGGSYSLTWDGGNVVAGKGWGTGGRRTVSYAAEFSASGTAFLALYGWTTDPLVEYYIVESWGGSRPSAKVVGAVGDYDIQVSTRTDAPSIRGTATFQQYWSVRRNERTSGSISTGDHFDAWEKAGLPLGSHDYMIMATEGYKSTGTSSVSVSG